MSSGCVEGELLGKEEFETVMEIWEKVGVERIRRYFTEDEWKKQSDYERHRNANLYRKWNIGKHKFGLDCEPPPFVVNWKGRLEFEISRRASADQKKRKVEKDRLETGDKVEKGKRKREERSQEGEEWKVEKRKREERSQEGEEWKVEKGKRKRDERSQEGEEWKVEKGKRKREERPQEGEEWTREELTDRGGLRAVNGELGHQSTSSRVLVAEDYERRYPKRDVKRVNYRELEGGQAEGKGARDTQQQNLVYCYGCKKMTVGGCIEHPMFFVSDNAEAVYGSDNFARESCPFYVSVGDSKILGIGSGVWADKFIPAGTAFGPYRGIVVHNFQEADKSGFSWEVLGKDAEKRYVDGRSEKLSNWMRYVNHFSTKEEQNLDAFQSGEGIYYVAIKDIEAGMELFVDYGESYHRTLIKECPPPVQKEYDLSGKVIFKCGECSMAFATEQHLNRHARRYERNGADKKEVTRRYACHTCPKKFQDKYKLERHLRVHTGEKPFRCEQCGVSFTQKYSLSSHQRLVHEKERSFVCDICGKGLLVNHVIKILYKRPANILHISVGKLLMSIWAMHPTTRIAQTDMSNFSYSEAFGLKPIRF